MRGRLVGKVVGPGDPGRISSGCPKWEEVAPALEDQGRSAAGVLGAFIVQSRGNPLFYSLAFALFLRSWCYLLLLCLSRQLSHLVWPGMAGLGQVLHRPASFFSCRTFFACSRAASFRSAVWFLACSYKRRASRCSSGVLLGVGGFRGFSFLGSGFLTLLGFLGFWLGAGLVSSKRCWKVLSSARGWGATTDITAMTVNQAGLSPGVRGNRLPPFFLSRFPGSIPASAGQPWLAVTQAGPRKVYPRECGATPEAVGTIYAIGGLSPRVRGNQGRGPGGVQGGRSIPASAGQPSPRRTRSRGPWVYPRECGATRRGTPAPGTGWGLSPRVRGNHLSRGGGKGLRGSIPASAGQPVLSLAIICLARVYPRECGATGHGSRFVETNQGLSPRVRGNRGRKS